MEPRRLTPVLALALSLPGFAKYSVPEITGLRAQPLGSTDRYRTLPGHLVVCPGWCPHLKGWGGLFCGGVL